MMLFGFTVKFAGTNAKFRIATFVPAAGFEAAPVVVVKTFWFVPTLELPHDANKSPAKTNTDLVIVLLMFSP